MKNIKILLLISSLSGVLSTNTICSEKLSDKDNKGTFLHKFAGTCGFARVKCIIPDMFDHHGIDPFVLDGNQQTARDIATARYELTKYYNCAEIAWELEEYEKRYQEKIAQQKAEQK